MSIMDGPNNTSRGAVDIIAFEQTHDGGIEFEALMAASSSKYKSVFECIRMMIIFVYMNS